MKSDIDRLMEEADLDALLVLGPTSYNPNMVYFTERIHLTFGYLLKKRGQEPVLFHQSMEREEAANTGFEIKDLGDYSFEELMSESGGDQQGAVVLRYARIFDEYKVQGRVGLYGKVELGPGFSTMHRVADVVQNVEFVGELQDRSVLARARATKDAGEVDRIRRMGEITSAVVADVAGFLTAHQPKNGHLVNREGEVLTIGEVKRRINLWLAMRGAENPEGTIFAVGRDAGIPHSTGQDDQPVRVGAAIIFDLFPVEARGGYFFDFTRTWAIGHASDELHQLHQDVLDVYNSVYGELTAGKPCRDLQVMTCERFEAKGHPTVLSSPNTQRGYVHSLAHGLGLDVHEAPNFWHHESNKDVLTPGMVFTFEPGLYYPDREIAVRLEDTVWARPDGGFEVLVDYPKDLVLKVLGA